MSASCSLCDRKSLLLYPVRYAVACPCGAAKAPALSGNFKIDSRAPGSVATAKYTLRALRAGYLYTYDEKRERLRAYMVLPNGLMWSFVPGMRPPPEDLVAQAANGCVFAGDLKFMSLGRCVDVEHTPGVDEATNLWIGWSNVAWTKTLVENASSAERGPQWRKLHMQCIDINSMLKGGAEHTGEFEAHRRDVAHFSMDDRALKEAFEFSNTPTRAERQQRNVADQIGQAMAQTPNKKGFIVAVSDPVGLTNDLAELTVPSAYNGLDEQTFWKATSLQLLKRAEAGIRARARETTGLSYGVSKIIADANVANAAAGVGEPVPDMLGFFRVIAGAFKSGSIEQAAKDDEKKMNHIAATQDAAAEKAWQDASTKIDAQGRRVSVLDENSIKDFPIEYQKKLDEFRPTWEALVHAHVAWLNSDLLKDWLTGVTDRKDIRSGYAYSESVAQAIGAGAGTDPCMKLLNDWLALPRLSDTRNLFARALLFSQDDLMKAADAQIHGSDVQYEAFMNIYKGAIKRFEDSHGDVPLRDRLMLTTANVLVSTLANGAHGAGWSLLIIRLHLQAGVTIKPSAVSKAQVRNWIMDETRAHGIDLQASRGEQRQAATQVAKQALKTAGADADIVLLQLDTDTLQRTGKIEEGAIKGVKVPGVETMKKWFGSAASTDFNLGVATAVIQMFTLSFATKDWLGSDQFSNDENRKKFFACVTSIFGNVVETAFSAVEAASKHPHPLSSFILRQWAGAERFAQVGIYGGRAIGAFAGAALAWTDLFKNAPEAKQAGDKWLERLYYVNGALGAYVAIVSVTGVVPGFWPVFVLSIIVSIGIAELKASQMKDWISRCKFSTVEHYTSLDAELKAFNSAAGD
ncbi:hypothetical protein C9I57_10320 [Trinickia symbiotica]|uniref:Toxin VasX N-terminal region domain-containing protein n=1 Tax=Trinickia symbiotica TaxID=863227 RepID=A0A2T3XX66_9BURK|nr:T6SS effector BTH_I2691 family protein [Trinickia symbiotica]PTB21096.1 hypothetical protein C9I57_10320 [Trinickia symbiotica]